MLRTPIYLVGLIAGSCAARVRLLPVTWLRLSGFLQLLRQLP
jgi:hypothetical protein